MKTILLSILLLSTSALLAQNDEEGELLNHWKRECNGVCFWD